MKSGISMLLTVLIIGSACLAMATSAVWLGVGNQELVLVRDGASHAQLTAESCLENALLNLKLNDNYRGESLSLGSESCIINIDQTDTPLTHATIHVVGSFADYNRSLTVTISVTGEDFKLTSWQEN